MLTGVVQVQVHLAGVGVREAGKFEIDHDKATQPPVEEKKVHPVPLVVETQASLAPHEGLIRRINSMRETGRGVSGGERGPWTAGGGGGTERCVGGKEGLEVGAGTPMPGPGGGGSRMWGGEPYASQKPDRLGLARGHSGLAVAPRPGFARCSREDDRWWPSLGLPASMVVAIARGVVEYRGHADKYWAVVLACQPQRAPERPRTSTVGARVLG